MALFEYLRVSLAKTPAPLLEHTEISRQEFLRDVFSTRWDFPYRSRILTYDPLPDTGPFIGGIIGREIAEIKSAGPDAHWQPMEQRYWPHAYVAIDIGEREQIAAFQRNGRIGSPRKLLESLFDHVAKDPRYSLWQPRVEYIATAEDFWVAAAEYAGRISSVNFKFLPPNMLRAKEAVDELVRAASEEANSEETELKLKNPGGNLVPKGDLVEAAVNTSTAGGGEVIMKVGKKTVYSSKKNRKTQEIEADDLPEPSSIDQIKGLFRRLLGKQ